MQVKTTTAIIALITMSAALCAPLTAQAADRKVMLPIEAALTDRNAENKLDDSVKLFFGKQATPKVLKRIASDKTSQRTNAFGKSDAKACNWVFLSSLLQLQKRAREYGANAVVNIVSNYNNIENSNDSEFECHAGAIMAGVALKGDFVKIAEK